ncbi:unnamed protein product [Larinioides sclopetarius]|uniref:C2H2-type domain-containing protein n=1 Tax=Larinioides sclopetarius TaxID=280406 RepID=A0AAV2B3Z8_9ARAC
MQSKFVKEISLTCKQNIASNYSFLTSSQNDNAPGKISDSGASVRESIHTKNDILEVPGPSGFRWSEDISNFLGGKLQLNYPSDMQSVVTREDKQFTCRVCKTKISTHTDGSRKTKLYYCCICEYNSCEKANLLMHSYKHCSKNLCNVCSKEYTDGDAHYSEQTCTVCEKTFHCRSQLDEHWMDHEDYFLKHCWVCYKSFDCHFREEEGKILFVCCDCEFVDDNISHLKRHNRIHRRKILCKICEEDYNITEKDSHKSEFKCIACKKKFQCKALLEDHFIVHTEYFLTYCRVCNRKLKEHQTENKKKLFFSCCICLKVFNLKSLLQSHLNFHTGLKLFKCDLCGKRFSQKSSLGKHSRTCSAVPYKCEICGARFPSNNFLDSHCSVKHRQAR